MEIQITIEAEEYPCSYLFSFRKALTFPRFYTKAEEVTSCVSWAVHGPIHFWLLTKCWQPKSSCLCNAGETPSDLLTKGEEGPHVAEATG